MPKRVNELSALEVKRLEHPGGANNWTAAVGGVAGLLHQITPAGARSWLFRYTADGKRRTMGLGSYPSVTLGMARERAREAADAIWRGEDPLAVREAERAARKLSEQRQMSFAEAMESFWKRRSPSFRQQSM